MKASVGAALVTCLLAYSAASIAEEAPGDWLQKMAQAVQTTNYDGTVIRIQNGNAEALKVVHVVTDGVIRERVIVQEGSGLEIIRNGNEVHCILPDRKSVLVEEWNDQSTLFSTLPSSEVRFGSEYDVAIVREERVAIRVSPTSSFHSPSVHPDGDDRDAASKMVHGLGARLPWVE